MDGMNSRYRRPGDAPTIRTNTGASLYDNDDMDIMEAEAAQKARQAQRASATRGHSGRTSSRNKRQTIVYTVIIVIEVLILIGIWSAYGIYSAKLKSGSHKASSSESGSTSNSINVDNDNFKLTCSKVSIATDTNGAPAAVIYFTFINKTDNQLSMADVFSPSVTQAGVTLPEDIDLVETPQEVSNKTMPIASGASIDCAYAFTLQDSTSELTITMSDKYETFSEIGSTVVPIS